MSTTGNVLASTPTPRYYILSDIRTHPLFRIYWSIFSLLSRVFVSVENSQPCSIPMDKRKLLVFVSRRIKSVTFISFPSFLTIQSILYLQFLNHGVTLHSQSWTDLWWPTSVFGFDQVYATCHFFYVFAMSSDFSSHIRNKFDCWSIIKKMTS